MLRFGALLLSFIISPMLAAQEGPSAKTLDEENLRSVLAHLKNGSMSEIQAFNRLDEMADEERYEGYLGPHILLASMSDLHAPEHSERVFRRGLSSLEGKEFVVFMMRYFDRAMEIDRNYIYDEERIQEDPKYREFWEQRQFYDFTVSEIDALAGCYDIFSRKDEWRESLLLQTVSEEPCSKLKDF